MTHLTHAQAFLESIHPAAPWLLLTLGIFLAVYSVRRFAPALWVRFDRVTLPGNRVLSNVLQSLAVTCLGALASVFLSGGNYQDAWLGALAGAGAPILHWLAKLGPGPYTGAASAITAEQTASKLEVGQ